MLGYVKGIALLIGMFALLACGTFATTQGDRVYDLARASAHSVCSYSLNSACRTLARIRTGRSGQSLLRS